MLTSVGQNHLQHFSLLSTAGRQRWSLLQHPVLARPRYGKGTVQVGALNHAAVPGRIRPLGSFLPAGDWNLGELSDGAG